MPADKSKRKSDPAETLRKQDREIQQDVDDPKEELLQYDQERGEEHHDVDETAGMSHPAGPPEANHEEGNRSRRKKRA
jgi:hypothetical protein